MAEFVAQWLGHISIVLLIFCASVERGLSIHSKMWTTVEMTCQSKQIAVGLLDC